MLEKNAVHFNSMPNQCIERARDREEKNWSRPVQKGTFALQSTQCVYSVYTVCVLHTHTEPTIFLGTFRFINTQNVFVKRLSISLSR